MSQYAELADLASYGAKAAAFTGISDADKTKELVGASAIADGYLRSRYPLPIDTWSEDLRMRVVHLATYQLLCVRGFNPTAGADVNHRLRHEDAIKWLEKVSSGAVHIECTPARTSPTFDTARVYSKTPRGF